MDDKKNKKEDKQTSSETNKKPETIVKEVQNNEVKKKIEEYQKIAEEYKSKYLRALADYQNLENRGYEEKTQVINNANARLILKLLPFLDSLDKAEVFIKDQGLKIIKDQFQKVLFEEGLEELKILGKEFDPYTAEVVDIIESDKDNIVMEVLRKGYEFNGKILRVAQVKVSKNSKFQILNSK